MKILVVDDDRDAADSLAMVLELFGHDLTVCYTALDGIATAQKLSPDIILHDLGMPELNGYQAVMRLRALPEFKDTLIIAVTAYDGAAAREQAARAGFDAFITKPADLDRLLQLLRVGKANA